MLPLQKGFQRTSTAPVVVGSVGVTLVLLLGGCSNGDRDVSLPSTAPPGAPSASVSPTSVEDAVKQSYTQYWKVLPQAEHADSESRRRQLLVQYSTEPQLSTALRGINDLHAKDLTSSGYVVVHIKKVQVNGDKATVEDCQDATKALIRKRSTGQVISRGVPNDRIRATLKRGSDGRWRISRFGPRSRC
jgi:hypothetical protein